MPTGDVSSKDREKPSWEGKLPEGSVEPQLTVLDRAVHTPAERLQEDISSHHVNSYIHPTAARQLLHRILQAALAVVHAELCSPLHRQLAFLVTSSCSYDLSGNVRFPMSQIMG